MNSEKLKFIPIAEPNLDDKGLENLIEAYKSTWISSIGAFVNQFEENFAAYCGVKYGVTTSNGTTALHLALAALGIGSGDEVIVPDITFAATINAVLYVGATPVIVDVEEDSWCIDPNEIEKAITEKTKAIIPVHIYGQPCNMDRIMKIAGKHKLFVIEDCAEAHGAAFAGKKVGSFGIISCFSFFGNKVITTGEGGMCLTDNDELNLKMRVLRDHGMNKKFKYYHDAVGFNYRMTNLQAAVGVAQLETIDSKLSWRKELEEKYRDALAKFPTIHFQRNDLPDREKTTWLVTILVETPEIRDKVLDKLRESQIDARPFFIPLSHMKIYENYVFSNEVSTRISKLGLNLPTLHNIGNDEMRRIIEAVTSVINNS